MGLTHKNNNVFNAQQSQQKISHSFWPELVVLNKQQSQQEMGHSFGLKINGTSLTKYTLNTQQS